MRIIPKTIETNCPELNRAWQEYQHFILDRSAILIEDSEEALNWHAFLGHSIDMQGFRAAEFAGVDELSKPAPNFIPLKQTGIGVKELGQLWQIESIRNHLLRGCIGTDTTTSYEILKTAGGETGVLLARAFQTFPFRKGHKYIRALLHNSAVLQTFNYSFRNWLKHQCSVLGEKEFPPRNFRQCVGVGKSLEEVLCEKLEKTFYLVGPEMAPYMICDWQLWLWKERKTELFDSFKYDAFHIAFVGYVNQRHGDTIPEDKVKFVRWWYRYCPEIPPRLANECIWLAMEHDLIHMIPKG